MRFTWRVHRSRLLSLRYAFLIAADLVQFGCASSSDNAGGSDNSNDPNTDLAPVPSHDDNHGWGTNIKGT
jgi:hypothetical protein